MLRNQRNAIGHGTQTSTLRERLRCWVGREGAAPVRLALVVLLGCATYAPQDAHAQSVCASCQVFAGVGSTYHFWSDTGGVVFPLTVAWDENRYEVGIFRFATRQTLSEGDAAPRVMADPYWGLSVSRRWRLFQHGRVQGIFGFGLSLKTESDILSISRWDFASQLGLRMRLADGRLAELAIRHWSNGGCRLPNHGQDFLTLTVQLNAH